MEDYNTNASISEMFGENVFDDRTMQARLPQKAYKKLKETITKGEKLDLETADVIAHEMKEWAIEKGATHFTHWFQPLTGETAEKHEAFMSTPKDSGRVLMRFSGSELIEGESDASSFPSGGLRATFEARGYTVWDCTSPVFIKEDATGATLCIPTAFCSYQGEALDQKTPLLRSMEAVSTQALRVLRLFGDTTTKRVIPNIGAEQEYFLIDREKYLKRKDLIYTGRTLIGAKPPKGQEMDDHYYGAIRQRVGAFMRDVDIELWKLGVPAKTEHNEVAPAQHELAPIFETANVATDHNQLIMETLKKVAYRHGLQALMHEKPFAGVNGSGKHNNWSLNTESGENLFKPGKTPHENHRFLLFLSCVLRAVDTYADLLRFCAASAGNDHRIGENEAPPAIISVYLGAQLDDILKQFRTKGYATHFVEGQKLDTGVATLPDFLLDATDRNRTSPFAFTGNKFEFRMIGSAESIGNSIIVLNTIVAKALSEACDELEKADDFESAVKALIARYSKDHERIIFNGNSYSDEWIQEAGRRGLSNISDTVSAIPVLERKETRELFEQFGVFSAAELESRCEISYEVYAKKINIEAKTLVNIIRKNVIPAVIKYSKVLADSINAVNAAGDYKIATHQDALKKVLDLLDETGKKVTTLENALAKAPGSEDAKKRATYYRDKVLSAMDKLRIPVDKLEMLVDKSMWPMPSYGDLMFEI